MSKVVNSFALLGDEEEGDVTVLVEHFAKKVGVTASIGAVESNNRPPQNQSQQVSSEGGRGREGRYHGPRNENFGRKEDRFSNEQNMRRNYFEGSNGNGYGQCRGGSRVRGRGRVFNNKNGNVDEKNTNEDASDGWQQVGRTHARGNVEDMNNNWAEEKPFRNGNKNFGGERRGYGNGHHRASRDVMDYSTGEQLNNIEVKENVDSSEVKENVDSPDANAVNIESSNAVSEWDSAPVTEEPKEASAEEKKPEQSVKAGKPAKKFEKEDENLMTLEEYHKVLAEKRKALEALKNEERKVAADKDFEAMQLLAKKKEEALLKPETSKLKKKDSLEKDDKSRKTLSINEFLKPADGEIFVYRRPGRGRGASGSEFRNRDRSEQGGFRNVNQSSEQGESRNKDYAQQSELLNKDRAEKGGFRGKVYPKEGRKTKSSPVIHIEDQGQFPVLLKGKAPAV
ncbi:hypothetical protein V2J09_005027 [Rumex salicifolius]